MVDRYPSDPSDPYKQLEERLRRLEQRLEEQNRRNPLNNGVFSGTLRNVDAAGNTLMEIDGTGLKIYDTAGNLLLALTSTGQQVYDVAGTLRVILGYLSAASGYGLHVADASGVMMTNVGDHGYRMPTLNTPWVPNLPMAAGGQLVAVTSATFIDVYQAEFSQITHEAFASTVVCTSDAATTGEFRLSADAGGTTSAVTIPAASAGTSQAFEWLHGLTLGTGPTSFRVQARRTGGAGNINVYLPARASLIDYLNGSGTGL